MIQLPLFLDQLSPSRRVGYILLIHRKKKKYKLMTPTPRLRFPITLKFASQGKIKRKDNAPGWIAIVNIEVGGNSGFGASDKIKDLLDPSTHRVCSVLGRLEFRQQLAFQGIIVITARADFIVGGLPGSVAALGHFIDCRPWRRQRHFCLHHFAADVF